MEWFLLFLATMASSQFQAARSCEAFFAFGLSFNALRKGVQGIHRVIYSLLFFYIVSC
jgi:hypothetical protein